MSEIPAKYLEDTIFISITSYLLNVLWFSNLLPTFYCYSQLPCKAHILPHFTNQNTGPGRSAMCKGHRVNKWLGNQNSIRMPRGWQAPTASPHANPQSPQPRLGLHTDASHLSSTHSAHAVVARVVSALTESASPTEKSSGCSSLHMATQSQR